ncbi:MAG: PEP-CTERM sorting domain-containing protein [Methylovulum sp.]|nr:PEP-CTERM sorting domain-containing protein [Methylovulum sp.]
MKRLFKTVAAGVMLVGTSGLANQAQAALIDDFGTAQSIFDQTNNGTAVTNTNSSLGASSVFSSRFLSADKTAPNNTAKFTVETVQGPPNNLNISAGGSTVKGTAIVDWKMTSGFVDLTDGGLARNFAFGSFTDDHFGNDVKIQFKDNANNLSNIFTYMTLAGNANTTFDLLIGLNHFSGVDLTKINEVKLTIDITSPSSQIAFNFVETIPEPSSLALMGLGLAGISVLRKRKAA